MSEGLDLKDIKKKYNDLKEIWDPSDKWSVFTQRVIQNHIVKLKKLIPVGSERRNIKILNAGSAGNDYGLTEYLQTHADIADKKISHIPGAVITNIESLPLDDCSFDICICVGSVINYCDALKSIGEFTRILKENGLLLLEFESSKSFEFVFKKSFNKSATIVDTFYNGQQDRVWVYSPEYIYSSLKANGFVIKHKTYFHILSPLIYRLLKQEQIAAKFAPLDRLARFFPFFKTTSANIILICQKP